jgi:hypothetical protein
LNMGHTGRQPVNPLSLVFFNIEKWSKIYVIIGS